MPAMFPREPAAMTPPRAAPPYDDDLPYAKDPEPLTAHEFRVLVLGVLAAAALGATTMLSILRAFGR